MVAELAPFPGTDFDDQFQILDADLPEDLPGLSIDDIFDEYLCVLGTTAASGAGAVQEEGASVAQLGAGSVGSSQGETASPGHSGGSTLRGEGGLLGRENSTESWNAGTANSHGSRGEYRLTADSPGCGGGQESLQTFPPAPSYGAVHAEQPLQREQSSQHSTSLPPIVQLPPNCQASGPLHNFSPAMSLEIPLPDFEIFPHPEGAVNPAAQSLDWLDAAVQGQHFGTENHALLPSFQEESRVLGMVRPNAEHQVFQGQALPDASRQLGGSSPCSVSAGRQQGSLCAPRGASDAPLGGGVLGNLSEGDQTYLRSTPDAPRVDIEEHERLSDVEDADMDGSPKKARRRRNRSERQQMLNKLAQQRYRERKRQKALDVEKAAAELSAKMKEYSVVKQKHKALSERNQALQQRLAERDAELADHASVAAQSHAIVTPAQATGPGNSMASHGDSPEEVERLTLELHERVFQLRQHLDGLGLLHAVNPASLGVLPLPALGQIESLVEEVSQLSIRAQRIEGVDVWHMVMRRTGSSGCLPGCTCYACRHKETWADIAASLCLTQEQGRKLLRIREQYARRLEFIFQERRQLNLEAVSTMLPPQDRREGAAHPLSGQVASCVFLGFFQRARHSAKLSDVLHGLKQNLRAEQRAASEVDYITFRRILNPVQGAIFILEAYPLKCDALALSHAVHDLHKNLQIGSTPLQRTGANRKQSCY